MITDVKEALLKDIEEQIKPLRVCFVCTGNTCRSPMAAAVLNQLGAGAYEACSAGISAITGDPISKNAVTALEAAGIENTPANNYRSHTATQISAEIAAKCDRIVAISKRHMMALIYAFPDMSEKITVMGRDIPDPFMGDQRVYDECLKSITDCIKETFAV